MQKVVTPMHEQAATEGQSIDRQLLLAFGLIAGPGAKEKRERLGDILRIGYTNGKQLEKRLAMFRITEAEFAAAMKIVEDEQ